MPPKRSTRSTAAAAAAPPPAPKPLEGLALVLSGSFPLSQATVKDKAKALGADVLGSVTANATHLVTTQHDFLRNTTKVKQAVAKDLPIVSLEWLVDCESNNSHQLETQYTVSATSAGQPQSQAASPPALPSPPATTAKGKKAGTKRGASAVSPDTDEEDAKPQPKRAKRGAKAATNGTAKGSATNGAVKAEDEDEEEDTKTAAKPAAKGRGKAKAGKAAKAAQADDEDEEEEEDTKPVAKGKGKAKGGKAAKDAPASKAVKAEPKSGTKKASKPKDIHVPVDEACNLSGYSVFIDSDNNIWDASLNQTNASNNNNKFYRIQVIHNASGNFQTWTRWGRVGERGQIASLGNGSEADAMKQFHKKFKDKSGYAWEDRNEPARPGKYTFIERSYNVDSDEEDEDDDGDAAVEGKGKEKWVPPESKLSAPVQDLMKLIFNQQYFAAAMSELNYDANKLPLGKLSKTTISRGFQALKDLAALFDDPSLAESAHGMTVAKATEHLSNSYYSLIPHAFGRNRPPVISEHSLLKKEVELLESLSDMKDASLIMKLEKQHDSVHPLDKMYNGLNMNEMTALDPAEDEFKQLKDYLNVTRGETHGHNYTVQDIFRIEREGETERFEQDSPLAGPPRDRRLLWHGSRVTNFGGILSQGLRIAPPEAPATGYMFGKGIYLADMSSKSANYCCSHISNREALLLVCEAELGDPMQKLTNAAYDAGETAKKQGMFSTWGQGSTGPPQWRDAESLHPSLKGTKIPDTSVKPGKTGVTGAGLYYNEFIVYDVSQVRLRYLLRIKM